VHSKKRGKTRNFPLGELALEKKNDFVYFDKEVQRAQKNNTTQSFKCFSPYEYSHCKTLNITVHRRFLFVYAACRQYENSNPVSA
jgi:hypothetical protein